MKSLLLTALIVVAATTVVSGFDTHCFPSSVSGYEIDWCTTWLGSTASKCYGMERDEAGNIYLIGINGFGQYQGYPTLVKFDSDGNYQWDVQCATEVQYFGDGDIPYSSKHIAISASGNPVVVFDSLSTGVVTVAEYDSDTSSCLYSEEIVNSEGPSAGGESDYSVVTDLLGFTYVHCTLATNGTKILRIDSAGNTVWDYLPVGGWMSGDILSCSNGYVVSTGLERMSPNGVFYDMQTTALVAESGAFSWENLTTWHTQMIVDTGTRVVEDPLGDILACCFSRIYYGSAKHMIIARIDSDTGDTLWSHEVTVSSMDVPLDIAVLGKGERAVYGGYFRPYWDKGMILFCDLLTGENITYAEIGYSEENNRCYEVEALPGNRAVIVGTVYNARDMQPSCYTGIFDDTATLIWEDFHSLDRGNLDAGGRAVQVDGFGNIYVAGYALNDNGQYEMMLIKYARQGIIRPCPHIPQK